MAYLYLFWVALLTTCFCFVFQCESGAKSALNMAQRSITYVDSSSLEDVLRDGSCCTYVRNLTRRDRFQSLQCWCSYNVKSNKRASFIFLLIIHVFSFLLTCLLTC